MTRGGSQLPWLSTLNSIFIMSFALRLEKGFARVNINDGMSEVMAWAIGLMFLFFVTQLIHWLNQ
jgi:ABC-type transport system involved in cytochrome bd biosynthesis fused ATPase/permease subunit